MVGAASKYIQKVPCPSCGQRLAIDTRNLDKKIRCPRCNKVYTTSDFFDHRTTLPAVTATTPAVNPEQAPVQQTVTAKPVHPAGTDQPPLPPRKQRNTPVQFQGGPSTDLPPPQYPDSTPPTKRGFPPPASTSSVSPHAEQPQAVKKDGFALVLSYIADFFDAVTDIGSKVDAWIYGKHGIIFVCCALFVVIAQIINLFTSAFWLEILAIVIFFSSLLFLPFLRLCSLRDEDGRWQFRRALVRIKSSFTGVWEYTVNFFHMSWAERLAMLAKIVLVGALVVIAIKALVQLGYEGALVAGLIEEIPLWLKLIAVLAWLGLIFSAVFLIHRWLSVKLLLGKYMRSGSISLGAAKNSINSLPPVLDYINQPDQAMTLAQQIQDPMLQKLLTQFGKWKPRKAYEYEDEYQGALYRHLKMYMPEAKAQREYPIKTEHMKRKGRIDVVLADFVAIEMKRDLRGAGCAQRASGQMMQYAGTWAKKGPLILLVCNSSPGHLEHNMMPTISTLRSQGVAAIAIAAGSRG
jgi:hypothetical protein